jgi:hypothetical protein
MARKSKNKANHGMRTHEALLSLTPSTELNAALIKPKFTPLPTSKFSTRFQTKGTRIPIKKDHLIKPKQTSAKYAHEANIDKASYRSYDPRSRRFTNRSEEAAYNLAQAGVDSRNAAKTTLYNNAIGGYNQALGTRTVAINKNSSGGGKGGGRGSVGANGVL